MLTRWLCSIGLVLLFGNFSEALCVDVPKANLRSAPSASAKLAWTVARYMPLVRVARKGSWYKVKDVDGKEMWIFSKLVTSRFDCIVVKASTVLLRSGPGKRYPKTPLGKARRYEPFKKIDRNGPWIRVQDDYGKKHWVNETNVWEPLEYNKVSI